MLKGTFNAVYSIDIGVIWVDILIRDSYLYARLVSVLKNSVPFFVVFWRRPPSKDYNSDIFPIYSPYELQCKLLKR